MKERTSGVRGRGIWRRRAESERAPAQECKRENEAEEKKNKEQSKRERERKKENQYLALKRGLHQRCNYAKCVLFTWQQATETSQPEELKPN